LNHTFPNKTNIFKPFVFARTYTLRFERIVNASNGNATAAKVCFNSGIGTLSLSITKPWLLTVAALLKLGGRGHGVNMGQQMPEAGVISPQRAWGFDWTYS